jgi:hypothetical protein
MEKKPSLNQRRMIDLTKRNLRSQLPDAEILRFIVYEVEEMHGEPCRTVCDIAEFTDVGKMFVLNSRFRRALKYLRNRRELSHPWPIEVVVEFNMKNTHPTHPEATYDPELSDKTVAGFSDIDGNQYHIHRKNLPADHPSSLESMVD